MELSTDTVADGERQRPERLVAAMRHGVLNGGKRVRPFLVVEAARLFSVSLKDVLPTACALECLHSFSLVHDDLPAMDDDDLRRGQPTVHKAFDEATAILAGDALSTLAFDILASRSSDDAAVRCELTTMLARASGWGGMIGGQVLDIEAEEASPSDADIRKLQAMKTGALICFACEAGAVLGKADDTARASLKSYGETVGLAFQLADDILDVTADTATLGKTAGKDIDADKGTLVALHGVDAVRAMLREAVAQAHEALSGLGPEADSLRAMATFIAERES
ncbi:MAG: polyprenyl synthetase family protein [Pseudomonadota bacterium]